MALSINIQRHSDLGLLNPSPNPKSPSQRLTTTSQPVMIEEGLNPVKNEFTSSPTSGPMMASALQAKALSNPVSKIQIPLKALQFGSSPMLNKWGLSEEDLAFQKSVRQYARQWVEPRAAQNDKDLRFDPVAVPELIERKILGISTPVAYGGMGKGYLQNALAVEEIARVDGSMGISLNAHYLAASLLEKFASPEQKEKYLRATAEGGLAALGMTEPNIGSDVASIESRAVKNGNTYSLNGKKRFITNANIAKTWVVLASTNPSLKAKGISAFILDTTTPGFTRGEVKDKIGMRGADWGTLVFENAQIPEANRVGQEGEGFKYGMYALDCGRILVSALSVGLAQGALDKALAYTKTRKQFDKPLIEHPDVQGRLAKMAAEIEVCRGYVYQVARMKDAGLPFSWEASVAKLQACDLAPRVTQEAMLLMGGNGYTKDYPVERYHRDSLAAPVVEGATGIQLGIIGRGLAKREPD